MLKKCAGHILLKSKLAQSAGHFRQFLPNWENVNWENVNCRHELLS